MRLTFLLAAILSASEAAFSFPFGQGVLGTAIFGDSDNDALSDVQEAALGTNVLDPDSDKDNLLDGPEVTLGTNPLISDSDNDRYSDGEEVAEGTEPLDANSSPVSGLSLTIINAFLRQSQKED